MIAQIVLASVFAVGAAGQAAATGPAEINHVGGDVLAPKLVHRGRGLTRIPLAVFQERIEGSVILEAVVTTRGKVADVKVRKSVHPLLDKVAIEDVRRWRYSPATQNGKPVACYLTVSIKYGNAAPPKPRPPGSLVGNWKVPEERIWIAIGQDNRAYQCRITTSDIVSKAAGVVSEAPEGQTIRWENDWPTDSVRRDGDELLLTSSSGSLRLRPEDDYMAASCSPK
jgi:TonB family protein